MNTNRIRDIKRQIRRVLLEEWDPIGVKEWPEAQDEYDSYLDGIYRLLERGASESDIVRHLHVIETVNIGLPAQSSDKRKAVAQALLRLWPGAHTEEAPQRA